MVKLCIKCRKISENTTQCEHCGVYFDKLTPKKTHQTPGIIVGFQQSAKIKPELFIPIIIVFLWTPKLLSYDYTTGEIMHSWMHNFLILFHEAGHIIFRIFGEFMGILGGSLMQLIIPGICSWHFYKNSDILSCKLLLWWMSVSFLDLAPYIYDAKEPQLILIGGKTGKEQFHDWMYILDRVSTVNNAHMFGTICWYIGCVGICCILCSVARDIYYNFIIKHNN